MWRGWFLGLSLAACVPAPPAAVPPEAMPGLAQRAPLLGTHMRAAMACHLPVSREAQDRAAAIEAAAIAHHHRQGGDAMRDAYLAQLMPPRFETGRQGRDRQGWCTARRADIVRVARWLDSAEGAAFAELATKAVPN
jgi:hypothetical protein